MPLPQPIQDQLEAAERLLSEPPAAPPAPPATELQPPQPAPAPEPTATNVQPPAPPDQDAAYWRQRFETMQGKYNAEVPRLHEQLREQGTALHSMQTQFVELTRQPAPAPTVLVTANDEEKFGADLVDFVRRVARDESRPVSSRIENLERLASSTASKADRVANVERVVIADREGRFYADLKGAVPDWQAINADPGWHRWLAEYDAVAGGPRQLSLNQAHEALDAPRVVAMFNLFKATLPPAAPSQREQAQADLARQVAPPRSSTTTVQPPTKPAFTGTQYAYWNDPRRVHDEKVDVVQANVLALEQAMVEGRIDWSK